MRKFLISLLALCANISLAADLVWFDGIAPVSYSVPEGCDPVVGVALGMFSDDMGLVTGHKALRTTGSNARLRIVQLDRASKGVKRQLAAQGVPVEDLSARKDGFFINTRGGHVNLVGNNGRGTAYAILEMSRLAGVSPWIWWSDVTPRKKSRLTLDSDYSTLQSPSVEYRGIFINDEDWSLQPWSWKTFEPGIPQGMIGPNTYKEIFKVLLRMRANAIWPGMHGATTPFYLVPGAKELADSCAIAIGTSHCEPLMRNNVGEWNVAERGDYNYITNGQAVRDYWAERLREAGGYENMYTIGMRGVHDGHMEGVNTMPEKVGALQQVINDQRNLLKKYVNKDVTKIPQVFVPYKEVLEIMENGLDVPEDVTLMWCDDNYGYMTRLSDEEQQKRPGGAGVYYHLSYWGRPHDYMWLTTTQPGLIYHQMKKAYDRNARKVWIVNVHDLKPSAYDLELFLDMAWDINSVKPNTIESHLGNWLKRELGHEAGEKLLPVMLEYYRLTGIRKPEFMGWTQVELDKRRYPRGRSQVINTDFSLTEFGGELDRYLQDYDRIRRSVNEIETLVPADRRDAYFSHVKYQVLASAAMADKMLEAQRARSYSIGQHDSTLWSRKERMLNACARSQNAYQEIRRLTDHYNNGMAGGRWRNSMVCDPRDLYVFYGPDLPVSLTDAEVSANLNTVPRSLSNPIDTDGCIATNACDYTHASHGAEAVQALGHSMKAVSVPKSGTLTYEFYCDRDGDATLYTAMIPTQPNDKGDVRYAVSIDGNEPVVISIKEKGRSEGWKQNVLRGQALKTTPVTLSKGHHTLKVKALDDNIVFDQWMIDFKPNRKFYLLPLCPSTI